jgi:competence protein ComGC
MNEHDKHSHSAFNLFEVCVLVCVIGILVAIIIPAFIPSHQTSAGNACINNLRQIDAAANQFALEHSLSNGTRINFPNDLTPYIKLNSAGKIPPCPAGGVYHAERVGEKPICSLGTTVTPAHVLP